MINMGEPSVTVPSAATLWRSTGYSVLAVGIMAGLVPWLLTRVWPMGSTILGGIPRWVDIVFLLAGAGVYGWCAWVFAVAGRGTPAPIDAPKELVVRGLYQFTRNPMYLGILMMLLAEAFLFASRTIFIYALIMFVAFHAFVLFFEEPSLRHKFGQPYEDYRRRVPRWWPRGQGKSS